MEQWPWKLFQRKAANCIIETKFTPIKLQQRIQIYKKKSLCERLIQKVAELKRLQIKNKKISVKFHKFF
jgi:hypothetical protein